MAANLPNVQSNAGYLYDVSHLQRYQLPNHVEKKISDSPLTLNDWPDVAMVFSQLTKGDIAALINLHNNQLLTINSLGTVNNEELAYHYIDALMKSKSTPSIRTLAKDLAELGERGQTERIIRLFPADRQNLPIECIENGVIKSNDSPKVKNLIDGVSVLSGERFRIFAGYLGIPLARLRGVQTAQELIELVTSYSEEGGEQSISWQQLLEAASKVGLTDKEEYPAKMQATASKELQEKMLGKCRENRSVASEQIQVLEENEPMNNQHSIKSMPHALGTVSAQQSLVCGGEERELSPRASQRRGEQSLSDVRSCIPQFEGVEREQATRKLSWPSTNELMELKYSPKPQRVLGSGPSADITSLPAGPSALDARAFTTQKIIFKANLTPENIEELKKLLNDVNDEALKRLTLSLSIAHQKKTSNYYKMPSSSFFVSFNRDLVDSRSQQPKSFDRSELFSILTAKSNPCSLADICTGLAKQNDKELSGNIKKSYQSK
ncbi:hypothetical protein SOPP22_09690 [Shewanella sp. OPT22]|nr:hypothetical protein SOPP22_09690 [Shewanella sp. OPT22]